MENKSKKTRVINLEQVQTATEQKKDFCSCHCHRKTIFDYFEISDKLILDFVDILESKKLQKSDGSWTNELEKLGERFADKKPCNCKH